MYKPTTFLNYINEETKEPPTTSTLCTHCQCPADTTGLSSILTHQMQPLLTGCHTSFQTFVCLYISSILEISLWHQCKA